MIGSSFRLMSLAAAAALAAGCAGAGSTQALSPVAHANGNAVPAPAGAKPLMVVIGHSEPGRAPQFSRICLPDSGCDPGGGGGVPTPRPTPTPAPPPENLSFQITVPARTSNPKPRAVARNVQGNRQTSYISQGTQSFTISMTPSQFGSPQTATGGCVLNPDNTSTCTVNMAIQPNQNVDVTASIFDAANGAGNKLALGSTTAYIQQGVANNITIYVDPLIAEVDFFLNDPTTGAPGQSSITLHANTASSFGGTIIVYDVDGYAVPDNAAAVNYRDPSGAIIAITPSVSGSGSASVTPTSFAGHGSGTTFSGSANGAGGTTATITPVIGAESAPCDANPLPPVCVTPASIAFQ